MPADFKITSLVAARDSQGLPQLSALVTNTGGRALDVTGELGLTNGPGELSAGPFNIQEATTLALGQTQNVAFTLSTELPRGPWTAQIVLKSGLIERQASATITFPDMGTSEAVAPTENSGSTWLPLVGIGMTLLAILTVAFLLIRHRRSQSSAETTAIPDNH